MYAFIVPEKYLDKMLKIKEESGLSIAKQIKMGIEDFVLKYEMSKSPFMRSLGEYSIPKVGEILSTDNGCAEILSIRHYNEVLDELELGGYSKKEIDAFTARVEHFLGNKERYFECDIKYEDGEFDRIDWSEYLAYKNKDRVILRQKARLSR